MDSGDFDIRFMAIKDLTTELRRDGFKLDERMQIKVRPGCFAAATCRLKGRVCARALTQTHTQVVDKLLQLLTTDANGEVQNQSVQWCVGKRLRGDKWPRAL